MAKTILPFILVALFAAPAQAAKPESVEPSITLDQTNPHLGDTITFTAVYPPEADRGKSTPRIWVECWQETLVYGEGTGANSPLKLGGDSSLWLEVGGDAECTADLFFFTYKPDQEYVYLASTEFHADG